METCERVVFLNGPGIYLRPPDESDLPHFVRWMNDPEVRIYLQNQTPMMLLAEKEWFGELPKRMKTDVILVLVDKTNDKPVGTFGVHGIDHRNGTATTGACIGEKEYWSKGFGTRAKMLILKHAFHTLNLRKIYSRVFDFNERSQRYSKKCGYIEEAILKEDVFIDGSYHDLHFLSVYRTNWEPLWKKFLDSNSLPW